MDDIEIVLDEVVVEPGRLDSEALDRVEKLLADFRQRYPATTRVKGWENGNEVVYLYFLTYQLARLYERSGDIEKVLSIYEDEISALTIDVPHYSWRLIGLSIPLYLETGRRSIEELRGWVLPGVEGPGKNDNPHREKQKEALGSCMLEVGLAPFSDSRQQRRPQDRG